MFACVWWFRWLMFHLRALANASFPLVRKVGLIQSAAAVLTEFL
jgi:hypothetical protein